MLGAVVGQRVRDDQRPVRRFGLLGGQSVIVTSGSVTFGTVGMSSSRAGASGLKGVPVGRCCPESAAASLLPTGFPRTAGTDFGRPGEGAEDALGERPVSLRGALSAPLP